MESNRKTRFCCCVHHLLRAITLSLYCNTTWRESENVINSVLSLLLCSFFSRPLRFIFCPFASYLCLSNGKLINAHEKSHEKLISFSIKKTTSIHIHFIYLQSRIINQFLHFSLCTLFSPVRHLTHNFIIIKHDTVSIFYLRPIPPCADSWRQVVCKSWQRWLTWRCLHRQEILRLWLKFSC